ncbi:MAG TPA: glycosyltransferase [Anaerolineales bacterium]|nr:glycosyltransferase [Anaerolineales bacterium]
MKITIIAPGSRGDVQPYVALGKGLKDAGHSVQILTTQDFRELVITYGLHFVDMGGQMQDVARQMEGLIKQGSFLKILKSMGQAAEVLVNRASQSGLEASQDSNRLIAGPGGLFVGLALSEKLGIPFIPAFYFPLTPTRAFPNTLAPLPPIHLPGWANHLSHHIAQQMLWQNYRAADTKARREVLGLPPASWWGPFASINRQQQTVLYGYSPLVLPPPADWGPAVHVTGYWFLDPPAGWEPPASLVDFLDSGSPPVFVGFGSMTNSKAEDTTRLVVDALARTGQRGVLSAGWGGLSQKDLPDTVRMIGSIPFSWLFSRMAAIVHHGGAGTTSVGLSAGVPSIVTPFMGDQPFWGQRVFELGVGPRPIPLQRLTAERLAQAIQTALTDTAMRQQAAVLGERIRRENGVARAVEVIEW